MKITAIIAAGIFAAASLADDAKSEIDEAIKNDDSLLQRYCEEPGKPCYQLAKAKEEAAVHLGYPTVENSTEWSECYKDGSDCQIAKRSAEALADAVANASPGLSTAGGLSPGSNRFCHLVGKPCLKASDPAQLDALSKREAEPWIAAGGPSLGKKRFCYLPGQPCLRAREPEPLQETKGRPVRFGSGGHAKRSALPAPEALRAGGSSLKKRYCYLIGQPCLQVRDAANAIDQNLFRRDVEAPSAGGSYLGRKRYCYLAGRPCIKARDVDQSKKENDLLDELEARCNESGAPCELAKRAGEDLAVAAAQSLEQAGL